MIPQGHQQLRPPRRKPSGPPYSKMEFRIKFLFADAQTIEETFPAQTTVAEAKTKLIASWPACR